MSTTQHYPSSSFDNCCQFAVWFKKMHGHVRCKTSPVLLPGLCRCLPPDCFIEEGPHWVCTQTRARTTMTTTTVHFRSVPKNERRGRGGETLHPLARVERRRACETEPKRKRTRKRTQQADRNPAACLCVCTCVCRAIGAFAEPAFPPVFTCPATHRHTHITIAHPSPPQPGRWYVVRPSVSSVWR